MAANECLERFFADHPRFAVALSGGVDSSFLLYAGRNAGCDMRAYIVQSVFQPLFELADAKDIASHMDVPLTVISVDVLSDGGVVRNGPDRCYHCKLNIFTQITRAAARDGFPIVADGTNASDDSGDRPGMRALAELGVRSPLRECGIGKAEIRNLSRLAGLPVWDKPSYACLATRIPTGTAILPEDLRRVEAAEAELFKMGFSDFRIRVLAGTAKLEIPAGQMQRLVKSRDQIVSALAPNFSEVVLSLKARRESV